jgi:hypothetical protein
MPSRSIPLAVPFGPVYTVPRIGFIGDEFISRLSSLDEQYGTVIFTIVEHSTSAATILPVLAASRPRQLVVRLTSGLTTMDVVHIELHL